MFDPILTTEGRAGMPISRRDFLKTTATSLGCAAALCESPLLYAKALRLPLAIQLYSVRELLPKDYAGTLKELGSMGFKEVESAGYYNHSVTEVRQALADAGLRLVSAHYSFDSLSKDFDPILEFHHELGVGHIICASPGRGPAHPDSAKGITLDDWRWNAEQFNKFGEKVNAAGMKFGYHNHKPEFYVTDGVLPYAELMRLTDPAKVTFEMDCGWVVVGGGKPIEMLETYPKRISMLHVKDFNLAEKDANGEPKVEELGRGSVDFRPIFAAAAKTGNIEHIFVEQEAFTVPWQQSLKIDADYMHKLGVA
jgi:sugar phosphate isomerase/epimerase